MSTPSRTSRGRNQAGAPPGRAGDTAPGAARTPGLQETLGNQALLRLLGPGALQAKPKLSQPGDPLEAEADRVAREILSRPAAPAQPRRTPDGAPPPPASAPPAVGNALLSAGQPLDPGTRDFMETRFGRDFGDVRVHTGPDAEAAAGALQARAFSIGGDVVFGRGSSDPGRELLAHELTHVAQQGHAGPLAGPPSSAPARPRISPATGAAGVLRKSEPPGQQTPTPAQAPALAAEPDYAALAVQIRKAIVGLGTDEEAVYRALRQLGRDANKIARIEALYLNQFGDSLEDDIRGDFSGDELDQALTLISSTELELTARRIRTAVEGLGTDEDAIYAALNTLGRDQTKVKQLKDTYKNLYHEDLITRINDEMSGDELGFALHLLRQPTALQSSVAAEGEKVAIEMKQTGAKMRWNQSGPGTPKPTDFWTWASAPSEGPLPKIAETTTMNCWEVVLLLAFRKKAVSWKWIHDVYVSDPTSWSENLVEKMSSGLQIPYQPKSNPPHLPLRGDIVFFDDAGHVALATGTRNGEGKTEVLSFWPPPDNPALAGALDAVKITNIEDLEDFMKKQRWNHDVTFATPPW